MATARPASDISAGTWSSTGETLHGVLSETTANDADYIYTSTAGVAVLGLDAVTDPGVTEGFVLNYRAASNDGARDLRVALREGTMLIAEETRSNVPDTETAYEFAVPAMAMEMVTDWSDLRLEFEYLVTPAATAPVLTQTSAAGENPMTWDTEYTDLIPDDEDYVVLRHRVDAGSWVTEDPVLVTSAWVADYIVDGLPHPWPLYDGATFAAGEVIDVQGGVTRGADDPVWSNTLTDTMAGGTPASVEVVQRHAAELDLGYGSGPAVINGITIADGDKVVVHIHSKFNGAGDITGVTANSGAITFTRIGASGSGEKESFAYYADTSGVTTINLSIGVAGSTHVIGVEVASIQGAAAGAPAASAFPAMENLTNPDPISVDGGLSADTGGVLLLTVMSHDSTSYSIAWTGATEIAADFGAVNVMSAAFTAASGSVTIAGQGSGGPAYSAFTRAITKWNAA